MRRKIELYIGGKRADLDDQGLILYNYALTDLEKPTAVKNAYSKQVTLPGTPANDAIFGHYSRLDRINAGTGGSIGPDFNPLVRTPFLIYDELGTIVESGYIKLDRVEMPTPTTRKYAVTLFGGLGSFLYGLMYDANGDKRPLSDMDYIYSQGGTDYPVEIGFTINKDLILSRWAGIDNAVTDAASAENQTLNFAPCYNGIPKDFDAGNVLFSPTAGSKGLPAYLEDEEENRYNPFDGLALAKVNETFDEWVMRDLRSYLQRPILNVKALLDTISQPSNNGGWTLNWHTRPVQESRLWLTLKTLDLVKYADYTDADIASSTSTAPILSFERTINVDGAGKVLTANAEVVNKLSASQNFYSLFNAYDRSRNGQPYDTASGAWMWQLQALDASDNIVSKSPVAVLTNATPLKTAAENAAAAWNAIGLSWNSFTPAPNSQYFVLTGSYDGGYHSGVFTFSRNTYLSLRAVNAVKIKLVGGFVTNAVMIGTSDAATEYNSTQMNESSASDYPTITYRSFTSEGAYTVGTSAVRTGATLTKAQVLNTDKTIADYLLSILKSFGLLMVCDANTKTADIWSRNAFYNTGEDVLDLTDRVDLSKGVKVTPLLAESKYYTFQPPVVEGEKAQEYEKDYTRTYGSQVINTGYDFNFEHINLASEILFRTPVPFVARGKNYTRPYIGTKANWYFPWEQYKRTLVYGGNGEQGYSQDMEPVEATGWISYAPQLSFSDLKDKMQMCGADGNSVAGEDCLMYLRPRAAWRDATDWYQVSDDSDEMFYLNGENACWYAVFDDTDYMDVVDGADVPEFSPLCESEGGGSIVGVSCALTFGLPSELYDYILGHWYTENHTLYYKYWRKYLEDILDDDTKVLQCYVHFRGLRVGPELLRRFFWYNGSLWVLNKITNYSLTTWDPVECEFIRVNKKTNYTNGQQ